MGKSALVRRFLDARARDDAVVLRRPLLRARVGALQGASTASIDALAQLPRRACRRSRSQAAAAARRAPRSRACSRCCGGSRRSPAAPRRPATIARSRRSCAAAPSPRCASCCARSPIAGRSSCPSTTCSGATPTRCAARASSCAAPDAPPLLLVARAIAARTRATSALLRELPRGERVHQHQRRSARAARRRRELARRCSTRAATRARPSVARDRARGARATRFFIDELARHVEVGEGDRRGELTLDEVLRARLPACRRRRARLLEVRRRRRPSDRAPSVALRAAELRRRRRHARWRCCARATWCARAARTATWSSPTTIASARRWRRSSPPTSCARRHARLAAALEAYEAADAEALAVHFHGAGERERAADFARGAAGRASEALAFDRAARLYRLALELDRRRTDARAAAHPPRRRAGQRRPRRRGGARLS